LSFAVGAIDLPGGRKIHHRPTGRLGGVGIVVACLISLVALNMWPPYSLLPSDSATGILLGLLPIIVTSVLDDLRSVRPIFKLATHVIGASVAAYCGVVMTPDVQVWGMSIHLGPLAVVFSVLWLVAVTSAFNLIDGLDGLAAGLGLMYAVAMTGMFIWTGQSSMAMIAAVIAGALAGFLPHNTYQARIFLGDTGAAVVGFSLAALSIAQVVPPAPGAGVVAPLFIFSLPLAELLVTVVRRVIRRVSASTGGLFTADRDHVHHRLMARGMGHRGAVHILYAAGAVATATGVASLAMSGVQMALAASGLFVAGGVAIRRLGYEEFTGSWRRRVAGTSKSEAFSSLIKARRAT